MVMAMQRNFHRVQLTVFTDN